MGIRYIWDQVFSDSPDSNPKKGTQEPLKTNKWYPEISIYPRYLRIFEL